MSDLQARIRALLAKAKSTDFEEEAATYLAKAQKLMVKYAIDQADLAPEERTKVDYIRLPWDRSYANHVLWSAICTTNNVTFVRTTGRYLTMVGFPSDLAFVQELYASLVLQREKFLRIAKVDMPHWDNGKSFGHSFRVAYGSRVYYRLQEAKQETVKSTGKELVFVGKQSEVDDAVADLFGKLKKGRAIRMNSQAGMAAGDAAGNRASLSGSRSGVASSAQRVLV